jgi:hypothetical protein
MRAKLVVVSVEPHQTEGKTTQETVTFRGVSRSEPYPESGEDENNSFALWSPPVDLKMTITNPNLFGKLVVGQEYYSDFTLAKDVASPFKAYKSHKVVEAARIEGVYSGSIMLEGNTPARTEGASGRIMEAIESDISRQGSAPSLTARAEFGYLVKYQDGYLSYSPKAAFEEGYTQID